MGMIMAESGKKCFAPGEKRQEQPLKKKKRQESRIEKEVPAAVLSYEQQIKQVDTKKEEHSATTETMTGNEGLSGPVLDPRQWVMYDAVFGPPRCRRPWKPFR